MAKDFPQFTTRTNFSQKRLETLKQRMQKIPEVQCHTDLCIYATGSYARGEASKHSDIDLFFVHDGSGDEPLSKLDQLRIFARVIDIGSEMKFPTFSNDGEFLEVIYAGQLLRMLGGREDDYRNLFTARMLLLLESVPLVNEPLYNELLDQVVQSYFRDYPNHPKEFRPIFLINDIIRFWKTLCLNYEHRRNQPKKDKLTKRKQQVKNFKLKFSRLMSCFGTVVAVCATESSINRDFVLELTRKVPLDRFREAVQHEESLKDVVHEVLNDYDWFMKYTSLSTEDLMALFDSKPRKVELFQRADAFGSKVFGVLDQVARKNNYNRYLVM